jgi:hypothetical protein
MHLCNGKRETANDKCEILAFIVSPLTTKYEKLLLTPHRHVKQQAYNNKAGAARRRFFGWFIIKE